MVLAIQAENLKIGYVTEEDSVIWAVRGIDLDISEGEVFCIVGESGCGKSTFANAIAGILPPHAVTRGVLRVFDRVVLKDSVLQYNGVRGRVVSYIPQNPGTSLNPFLNIEDHFYYVLRDVRGLNKQTSKKIALENLYKVGLDNDILSKYPHELSGGMQQRVLIALALASGAKILVADEPTSSIDSYLKTQILRLIGKLNREYRLTVFLVTHDILFASDLCNRIAVMYAGQIIEQGFTRSILNRPAHPYTKILLKSIPILGSKKSLEPLHGDLHGVFEDTKGCSFKDRCPFRSDICDTEPSLTLIRGDTGIHYVKCWRYDKVLEEK